MSGNDIRCKVANFQIDQIAQEMKAQFATHLEQAPDEEISIVSLFNKAIERRAFSLKNIKTKGQNPHS